MEKKRKTVCQLRKAAGIYWLLHMDQAGPAYKHPVPLNESGARIWQMLEQHRKPERLRRSMRSHTRMRRRISDSFWKSSKSRE